MNKGNFVWTADALKSRWAMSWVRSMEMTARPISRERTRQMIKIIGVASRQKFAAFAIFLCHKRYL